jgi:hypothetical protein
MHKKKEIQEPFQTSNTTRNKQQQQLRKQQKKGQATIHYIFFLFERESDAQPPRRIHPSHSPFSRRTKRQNKQAAAAVAATL